MVFMRLEEEDIFTEKPTFDMGFHQRIEVRQVKKLRNTMDFYYRFFIRM